MKGSNKLLVCAFILVCYSELLSTSADYGYGYGPSVITKTYYGVSSPLIAKLRSRIKGLGLDHYYTSDRQLARYIESSGFNVERAAKLLTKTAQWRKSSGADTILNSPRSATLAKHFPYECTGHTDEGLPVIYLPIGSWNFRAVRLAGLGGEISKYLIRILEEIRGITIDQVNPKTGEPVDQVIIIENLDGYTLKNLLNIRHNQLLIIGRYLRNIDRHYPFLAKKYIVLRSPVTLQAFWQVMRKTTPRLRKVFHIYNRLSTRGPDELVHTVPKRAIPAELGGTHVSLVTER